jgi:hypothetical protein
MATVAAITIIQSAVAVHMIIITLSLSTALPAKQTGGQAGQTAKRHGAVIITISAARVAMPRMVGT